LSHANAKLTPAGRLLIIQRLAEGWTQAQVAEAQGVSRSTVAKWAKHYREEGEAGLRDRSSRPRRTPHALAESVVEAICRLRGELGCGPHRIACELGMHASTVYGVLKRAGLSVLARLDRTTRSVIRYERGRPGELIHLDIKKLGRIPQGGGKRIQPGWRRPRRRGTQAAVEAMTISTSPSTITAALPTPKPCRTRRAPRLPTSWCGPPSPSPRWASMWSA
jgi:transposase